VAKWRGPFGEGPFGGGHEDLLRKREMLPVAAIGMTGRGQVMGGVASTQVASIGMGARSFEIDRNTSRGERRPKERRASLLRVPGGELRVVVVIARGVIASPRPLESPQVTTG